MKRLLLAAAALLCAFGLVPLSRAQLTTVTAAHIYMGGVAIPAGTVTLTPVNALGTPIPFAQGGGGLNAPTAFSCTITAGAITGTCQVPDAALTTPANILYTVQIVNTATQKEFTLQGIPNITGSTWPLDAYGPPSSSTAVQQVQVSYGTAAPPNPCVTPSIYIRNNAGGQLYMCVGGTWVAAVGGSYTPPTGTGFAHFTSGSPDGAARAVNLASADVTGVLPFSNLTLSAANVVGLFGAGSCSGYLKSDGTCATPSGGGGGLTSFTAGNLSPLFTVSLGGSPTTAPALAFTASTAAQNVVLAGPSTGGTGAYSFRALVPADIPTLNQPTTGNAGTASALAGTPTLCSTGQAPTGILPNGNATGCASITGGSGLGDPGANGLVYRTAANTTAAATAAQVQAVLASDTTHNTEVTGSQAAGGSDVVGTAPTANKSLLLMQHNEWEISNNGDAFAKVARVSDLGPSAYATLTDGATVTWATGGAASANAALTLVHTTSARTLNMTGLVSGESGTLVLKEDSTGVAGTFTLGTGCTWYVGGSSGFTAASTLTLTSTANAINIAAFTYDGTNCYVNLR